MVFCGTFTTDGLEVAVENGRLRICREGKVLKFVKSVEQVSFSGTRAAESGRDVLFVTERAVFRLIRQGLQLLEIADGIDLERDILQQMQFRPTIGDVQVLPAKHFSRGI